jgi:hypothetical protein
LLAFAPSPAAAADAPVVPRDAVQVRFHAEDQNEKWSLVTREGAPLCLLPCSRWVSPGDDVLLQRDVPGSIHVDRIALPMDLKAPPGGSADAVARLSRNTRGAGIGFELLAATLFPVSVLLLLLVDSSHSTSLEVVAVGGLGVTAVSLGLGVYLRASSHPADVVLRAASAAPVARPRFALRPGFVEVASPGANGLHLVLTPLGAVGSF